MRVAGIPDHPAETVLRRLGPSAGAVLLAPVAAAAVPLWAVSALIRWLGRQPLFEPPAFPEPIVEYAPGIGARPRPHLDCSSRAQDVFRLTTDADGWRGSTAIADADVVAFGDSFAFGYGVDDADCLTEHAGGLVVKAVASPAYSMVHSLLWMRRLADRLGGKTVVWFLFCGNDLSDNLRPDLSDHRMPFVRQMATGGWEVVTDHVSAEPWTFGGGPRPDDELFAAMCTPSADADRALGAADHLIGEAAAVCRAAGARLAVASIPPTGLVKQPEEIRALASDPARADLDAVDRRLAASCARRDLPFVALRPLLRPRHYWRDDMHWNAAGHRLAGRVVTALHQAAGGTPAAG